MEGCFTAVFRLRFLFADQWFRFGHGQFSQHNALLWVARFVVDPGHDMRGPSVRQLDAPEDVDVQGAHFDGSDVPALHLLRAPALPGDSRAGDDPCCTIT